MTDLTDAETRLLDELDKVTVELVELQDRFVRFNAAVDEAIHTLRSHSRSPVDKHFRAVEILTEARRR
jgi:hypothetical protein